MDFANIKTMNTKTNGVTFDLDEFRLDGVSFKGIGHEMLKSQNQLNYTISPGRQSDGSMKNIEDYKSFILPKVEIGFKFIDYDTFQRLRIFLLSKRTFNVQYYDKDFNAIVTHEMYAEPDDLTAFFNLGEKILGSREFTLAFIATLNEDTLYTATFVDATFVDGEFVDTKIETKWGRSVIVPPPPTYATNGYWKTTDATYKDIKFYPNKNIHLIKDGLEFTWQTQ